MTMLRTLLQSAGDCIAHNNVGDTGSFRTILQMLVFPSCVGGCLLHSVCIERSKDVQLYRCSCLLVSGGAVSWVTVTVSVLPQGSTRTVDTTTTLSCWTINGKHAFPNNRPPYTWSENNNDGQMRAGGSLLLAAGAAALISAVLSLVDVISRGKHVKMRSVCLAAMFVALLLGVIGTGLSGAKINDYLSEAYKANAATVGASITYSLGPAYGASIAGVIFTAAAIVSARCFPAQALHPRGSADSTGRLSEAAAMANSARTEASKQNPLQQL